MGLRVVEVFEGEVGHDGPLLVRELALLGVDVHVVCPPHAVLRFVEGDGVRVTGLAVGAGVPALAALRRVLRAGAPDEQEPEESARVHVVHAHGLRAGAAAALARTGGTPLVLSWSDPSPTAGAAALVGRALARTVVPAAVLVLAATPELADEAGKLGATEVLFTPPTLPDPVMATRTAEQVREELALPAQAPIVLAQARLLEESRLDVLVGASARWRRAAGPGYADGAPRTSSSPRVVLVGVGPAYRDLVARATVARAPVTFAGEREPQASAEAETAGLEDLLAAATVAVVTDPRARPEFALRAVRLGVPLIVPHSGMVAQLLGSPDGAVAVPTGDVDALAAAVPTLIDEPPARADLAAAARKRIESWPDAQRAGQERLEHYERVSRATQGPA